MQSRLLKLPPLDTVRGFVAVARRMSITQAAADLCLTQSALSRQVQTLEAALGTPLLVRSHRAIGLTPAGEELLQLASPWLERLAEFKDSLAQDGRARPVTITASIGVTTLWILPRLGAFQSAHPHIDVRVAANNRIVDLHQEGIDLAIRYCREVSAPHDALRLFGEEVVPVAHPAVAAQAFAAPGKLLDQVLLELDDRARPWMRWADWLSAQGLGEAKPRAFLHFNQYDQIVQAALEGHGVALGRLPLVSPMLRDGRLVAQAGAQLGVSDFAFWLIEAEKAPRSEVATLAAWIRREAEATVAAASA